LVRRGGVTTVRAGVAVVRPEYHRATAEPSEEGAIVTHPARRERVEAAAVGLRRHDAVGMVQPPQSDLCVMPASRMPGGPETPVEDDLLLAEGLHVVVVPVGLEREL